jgi:hypothetical protein
VRSCLVGYCVGEQQKKKPSDSDVQQAAYQAGQVARGDLQVFVIVARQLPQAGTGLDRFKVISELLAA